MTTKPSAKLDAQIEKEIQPDGSFKWFAIHPVSGERVEIDPDQAWFWSTEWQAKEREADADIEAGNYVTYEDPDDFIASL